MLEIGLSQKSNPIHISEDLVTAWHDCLNKEVFHNILQPMSDIHLLIAKQKKDKGLLAEFCVRFDVDGEVHLHLHLLPIYLSMNLFVTVFAHEMVHQWQGQEFSRTTHGPSFMIWKDRLTEKGIDLQEQYRC